MSPQSGTALRAERLSYRIGDRHLLRPVSLGLRPGEVLVVAGPNGAGKSTLLKLLAGDLRPSTGRVWLFDQALDTLGDRAQASRRAVMGQRLVLSAPFTGLEVTLMGRHPHLAGRGPSLADLDLARAALGRVAASALADRRFPTLSGGEQMRVGLAKTIAQAAPLLLLDEPTAALDLGHQMAVVRLLRSLAAEGSAVVAVLHDLNLAAMAATRILLLHQGATVALGTPEAVLRAETLAPVYGVALQVLPHPTRGVPHIIVLGEAADSPPIPSPEHAHALPHAP